MRLEKKLKREGEGNDNGDVDSSSKKIDAFWGDTWGLKMSAPPHVYFGGGRGGHRLFFNKILHLFLLEEGW